MRLKGIASIVLSSFGFALMALFVRLCDDYGQPLGCFQKGFFRNAIALVIAAAVFWGGLRRGVAPGGGALKSGKTLALLALRCIFGSVGIFANFYALSHIHIGEAMSLNKTAPIFTVLLSWWLLGEKASRKRLLMLGVGFAGVLMILKPGLRVTGMGTALIGVASGLSAGIAYTCLHQLGRARVNGALIVLVFSAFSCLVSIPLAALEYRPMTPVQTLMLVGAGIGAAIGQFGITAAYRFVEPREIAGFDYFGVVFSVLFGIVFLGQILDWTTLAGIVLIFVATL